MSLQTEGGFLNIELLFKTINLLNEEISKVNYVAETVDFSNTTGENVNKIILPDDLVTALTFVEGTFFAEIKPDENSYQSLGAYMANLNSELLRLRNPVIESRVYHWNIQNIRLVEDKISYIQGASRQNLVRYFIMQYRENAESINHRLRHSILHNDSHEWNILIENNRV